MEKFERIKSTISSLIATCLSGGKVENAKFDFKLQWYNLREDKGKFQFLKDCTAIANTIGPTGYIIIGFDDKSGNFLDQQIRDSGVYDSSEIIQLINKNVDELFNVEIIDMDINNHKISVIEIPPSLNKPHIIREYKTFKNSTLIYPNEIFVRYGSMTRVANKYDIDAMYYDRKNIVPDFLAYGYLRRMNHHFLTHNHGGTKWKIPLTIENAGQRWLMIRKIELGFVLPTYETTIHFNNNSIYQIAENAILVEDIFMHCHDNISLNGVAENAIAHHLSYELNNGLVEFQQLKLHLFTGDVIRTNLILTD